MRSHRAQTARTIRLPIVGLAQKDDYSCGAYAGWSVVEFLNPQPDFGSFYDACRPNRHWGTSTAKLSAAMRQHGITIAARKDLDFDAIRHSIERGWPVLLSVSTMTEQFWHWVVVFGVGWNPRQIHVSASLPGRARKEVLSWRTFERHWRPSGFGLICKPRASKRAPAVAKPGRNRIKSLVAKMPRRKRAA